MIGALKGEIFRKTSDAIVVMAGNVGYIVHLSTKNVSTLSEGQTILVHTYTLVRQDTLALFGFLELSELRLFELLLSVSGVGPKTALSVVSLGTNTIEKAIAENDVDIFTTVPRLGKKNAQKIIIELKSKIGGAAFSFDESDTNSEVVSALTSMGFARTEVTHILPKLSQYLTLEEKVRAALKLLH